MKLLFLNTNIGYGGASKMIVWLANQCAHEGHDVTFVTYRDSTKNQNVSNLVKHIHFDLENQNGGGKGLLYTIYSLRKFIKHEKFDVATAFLPASQIRLSLACLGLKTKLLYSHRGDPYQRKKSLQMRIAENIGDWLFSFADYYVFQTVGAQQYYSKSIQNKSTIIPNPIKKLERSTERQFNIERKVVCVARLDLYQKRQDVLIEAFFLIENKYPDVVLEFYGDGSLFDEQKLRAMSVGHKNIKFMGKADDSNIINFIQNASVAVLSSDFEGIPNALLEYMSLGIPSISTDCSPGGASMIIKDKVNGLLVPCNNPMELAKALDFMLDNVEAAEKMGFEGRKVVDIYSEHKIKTMWINVLNQLKSND